MGFHRLVGVVDFPEQLMRPVWICCSLWQWARTSSSRAAKEAGEKSQVPFRAPVSWRQLVNCWDRASIQADRSGASDGCGASSIGLQVRAHDATRYPGIKLQFQDETSEENDLPGVRVRQSDGSVLEADEIVEESRPRRRRQ